MNNRQIYLLQQKLEEILNKLCRNPHLYNNKENGIMCESKVAKYFLLNHDTLMANGVLHETKVKSMGAGVYKLWIEAKNIKV